MAYQKGKLRKAAELIHANLVFGQTVALAFGRRTANEHQSSPCIKFIPIGGTIAESHQTAGKQVVGSAGMIEPGPNANLTQPDVTNRQTSCATREPRMMVICIAGDGEEPEAAIDQAEALLEAVMVAAFESFPNDVVYDSERWLLQEEERASLGVTGEAVALVVGFKFPVIREVKPLVKIIAASHTCKLNSTLSD